MKRIGMGDLSGPTPRLGLFGLCLLPLALFAGWGLAPTGVALTGALFLAGLALALRGMAVGYPHATAGACNLVTTARLALASALASVLWIEPDLDRGLGWAIFAIAIVALMLDGVDGWLARQARLCSAFGARYDMEVDALLAAVLALVLLVAGRAGPELLILGAARYAFVLASQGLPWLTRPLPPSRRRKAVCVIQITALAALTLPILPDPAARPLAISAAALVVWSFALDIRWLATRR